MKLDKIVTVWNDYAVIEMVDPKTGDTKEKQIYEKKSAPVPYENARKHKDAVIIPGNYEGKSCFREILDIEKNRGLEQGGGMKKRQKFVDMVMRRADEMRADAHSSPYAVGGGYGYIKKASKIISAEAQTRKKLAGRNHFTLEDFAE